MMMMNPGLEFKLTPDAFENHTVWEEALRKPKCYAKFKENSTFSYIPITHATIKMFSW